ncbi:alkaline phosphatase family protein [Nonomuraea lactucae]|uniref:alkaline phosphatase family protein n=1 Tax=Nonomuraea lactucae TaxID=2249762 RepID=UPI001965D0FC|nr:alkaline phosphatase family protein [Nonomuraea lactucae]
MRGKVLVVGMDGLRFDRLTALRPPVLDTLMSTGAYGTSLLPYGEDDGTRTESPGEVVPERAALANALSAATVPDHDGRVIRAWSDSGPGWSSIATGVWPDKHGVVDNNFVGAQYAKYPDFLTRVKEARPELATSAFFSWPALDEHATFSTAIDTRVVFDGYGHSSWSAADRQVAEAAREHLAGADPDLTFVYLGDTDEVAHELGPHCQEFTDALFTQDTQLGAMLDAIRARPSFAAERWTVLITTDHGHVDEGGHGGVSAAERTVFVIANRLGDDLGGASLGAPRLVDVAPTVLAVFGVEPDPAWEWDGEALRF